VNHRLDSRIPAKESRLIVHSQGTEVAKWVLAGFLINSKVVDEGLEFRWSLRCRIPRPRGEQGGIPVIQNALSDRALIVSFYVDAGLCDPLHKFDDDRC